MQQSNSALLRLPLRKQCNPETAIEPAAECACALAYSCSHRTAFTRMVHCMCSGVREAAMTCIEELHQQLGGTVVAKLEALNVKPAQLRQLQARLQQLAISGETVQDFPLFQAVTAEPHGRRPGSATSRSDRSAQVRLDLPTEACFNKRAGSPNRHLRKDGIKNMTNKNLTCMREIRLGILSRD